MENFEIFLSYSHCDLQENYPGYDSNRYKDILGTLFYELRCYDKRIKYSIAKDKDFAFAGKKYNVEIGKKIPACDMGLIVLTPGYRVSEECRAELVQFLALEKRICILETEEIWDEDFERELREENVSLDSEIGKIVRVPFYSTKGIETIIHAHPLLTICNEYSRTLFLQSIEFAKKSIQLHKKETAIHRDEDPLGTISSIDEHVVFIATPTAHIKPRAEQLHALLEKNGISALYYDPNNYFQGEDLKENFVDATKIAIDKCGICVQLFDMTEGRTIADNKPLSHLQYELIKDTSKPFFVWESIEQDYEEFGEHGKFLQSIDADIHRGSFESFVRYLCKNIETHQIELEAEKSKKNILLDCAETALPNGVVVGVDFAIQDEAMASGVIEKLGEYVLALPMDEEMNLTEFKSSILDKDGIVMLYGKSREGQNRIKAHFPIAGRIKAGQKRDTSFQMAMCKHEGHPAPKGPAVFQIDIDPENFSVDQQGLNDFVTNLIKKSA